MDRTFVALFSFSGLHFAACALVRARRKHPKVQLNDGTILTAVGHVSDIVFFPIKSIDGISLKQAECKDMGLYLPQYNMFDRYFALVNWTGTVMCLSAIPKMALIKLSLDKNNIILTAPGMDPLLIPINVEVHPNATIHQLTLIESKCDGIDCGEDSAKWLQQFLGKKDLRLMRLTPKIMNRLAKNAYFGKIETDAPVGDTKITYNNAAPFSILSQASVDKLNSYLDHTVPISNFRPNIVVDGCSPYAEDHWDRIQMGSVVLKQVVLNARCPNTTVNHQTGKKHESYEPLTTLRRYRPIDTVNALAPRCGVYLMLEKPGKMQVGDTVYASVKDH